MAVYGAGIFFLGGLCIASWLVRRYEDTRARRDACRHEWTVRKAQVRGDYWSEHCDACGAQRPCPAPSRDASDE